MGIVSSELKDEKVARPLARREFDRLDELYFVGLLFQLCGIREPCSHVRLSDLGLSWMRLALVSQHA